VGEKERGGGGAQDVAAGPTRSGWGPSGDEHASPSPFTFLLSRSITETKRDR
jgi:hypothetical protein